MSPEERRLLSLQQRQREQEATIAEFERSSQEEMLWKSLSEEERERIEQWVRDHREFANGRHNIFHCCCLRRANQIYGCRPRDWPEIAEDGEILSFPKGGQHS
jgi:hypothetical protein